VTWLSNVDRLDSDRSRRDEQRQIGIYTRHTWVHLSDRTDDDATDRQTDKQRERQYLGAVCRVVQVVLGVRVWHASRVTSDDVEVDAGR